MWMNKYASVACVQQTDLVFCEEYTAELVDGVRLNV